MDSVAWGVFEKIRLTVQRVCSTVVQERFEMNPLRVYLCIVRYWIFRKTWSRVLMKQGTPVCINKTTGEVKRV